MKLDLNASRNLYRRTLLVGALLAGAGPLAHAEAGFPNRPITMVVPFTAAGPTDSLARALAQAMRTSLGQSVIIDNRPGAGGNIGTVHVVRSSSDGYTLLFGSSGPLNINSALYRSPGFDPLKDFTPIAYVGEIPNVLVVPAQLPVKSLPEFLAYVKGRSDLSYGSSGSGSTNHLAGEMFNKNVGASLVHVPYKGTAPALNDLLGAQITMMYLDVLTALPHIKSGKLRALGVAAAIRSRALPDVPTFAEQAVASMDQGVAFGLVGPAGLSPHVLKRLSDAAQVAMKTREMQDLFARQGVEPTSIASPQAYAERLRQQVRSWGEVVRVAGARAD